MTHKIEPGDCVQFNAGHQIERLIVVVGDVDDICHTWKALNGTAWWPLSDVTLIAKGLGNLPESEPWIDYPDKIGEWRYNHYGTGQRFLFTVLQIEPPIVMHGDQKVISFCGVWQYLGPLKEKV